MCALCMSNVDWESEGLKKLWGRDVVMVGLQETNNFFLGLIDPTIHFMATLSTRLQEFILFSSECLQ